MLSGRAMAVERLNCGSSANGWTGILVLYIEVINFD